MNIKSSYALGKDVKGGKSSLSMTNGNSKMPNHGKEKKKSRAATKRMLNRFNGMTEEEVAKRGLPDYLKEGLDIVFIGINPVGICCPQTHK